MDLTLIFSEFLIVLGFTFHIIYNKTLSLSKMQNEFDEYLNNTGKRIFRLKYGLTYCLFVIYMVRFIYYKKVTNMCHEPDHLTNFVKFLFGVASNCLPSSFIVDLAIFLTSDCLIIEYFFFFVEKKFFVIRCCVLFC